MKKIFSIIIAFLMMTGLSYATVTGTSSSVSYTCTGSPGPYPFTFPVTPDSTALVVTETNLSGVVTTLNQSNYTAAATNNSYLNGGNITLTSGCPVNYILTIQRNTPLTQTSVFTDGMPQPYKTFERGLDKLTMENQDIRSYTKGDKGDIGGYDVDALATYGAGVNYTDSTITSALAAIGTTNKATLLLAPGTWTISTSKDWSAYTNVTFRIPAGTLLYHGAYTLNIPNPDAGLYQWLSGTGAVTFSGSVKAVYPEWWGAKADGTTDSTTAIQNAINSLPVFTSSVAEDKPPYYGYALGGSITLSIGTYKITSSLSLGSFQGIVGQGKNTLLYLSGTGTSAIKIIGTSPAYASGVVLDNFILSGSKTNNTVVTGNYGIQAERLLRSRITRLVIAEFADDAIYIKGGGYNYIQDNYINENNGWGVRVVGDGSTLWATDSYISNNSILINHSGGIYFYDVNGGARIHHNTIESNGSISRTIDTAPYASTAVYHMNVYFDQCTGLEISDNYIEQSVYDGDESVQIVVSGGFGNTIRDNFGAGTFLILWGGTGSASYNDIVRNRLTGGGGGSQNIKVLFSLTGAAQVPSDNRFLDNQNMDLYQQYVAALNNDVRFANYSDKLRHKVQLVGSTAGYLVPDCGLLNTGQPKGNTFIVTLTESTTINPPTNMIKGEQIEFIFIQGGSGGYNVSWQSTYKQSWSNTGNTTGKISSIVFRLTDNSTTWYQVGAQSPYY